MKLKAMKSLPEDVLMRFLIDTFDEITTIAKVEEILDDVKTVKSDVKLFDSKELSLRFINSTKRTITNNEMTCLSILDDTIALNYELCEAKVGTLF